MINGGDVENSGIASASASRDQAHTGSFSAALTITTPSTPDSGTRLFRWREPRAYPDLYYRVWYYFPQISTPNGNPAFWNVLQWKSEHVISGARVSDPFFVLNVGEASDNGQAASMYFSLCPPKGGACYSQVRPFTFIPVGNWFEVEARYVCAGDDTGHVTIWQNGSQAPLFDIPNVQTRYADGDCSWSVDNYSNSLSPSSGTVYIDDAEICSGGRCPQ